MDGKIKFDFTDTFCARLGAARRSVVAAPID
jgi:hypothetical protein